MLLKQKVIGVFKRNVKICQQNKKMYLMPHSRHDHFHPILILPINLVQLLKQHENTSHWLLALPLPIVAKSFILKTSVFENFVMYLNQSGLCENQSFFLLFQNAMTFTKNHQVFLCYFLQHDEVFLISLFDSCYHYLVFMDPVSDIVQSQNYL